MKNRAMYVNELVKYIDTPVIKIITGIRRCGKSYLLKLLCRELKSRGTEEKNIININFESLKFNDYRDHLSLYNYVSEKRKGTEGKIYILIDEIQEVAGWELAVRSFTADFDCDIYLTGSNARLLSGELATHLAGRYVEFSLFPLSFKEYLDFYDIDTANAADVEKAFYTYVRYGGFPGLYQLPEDEDVRSDYIQGINNSVVLKDVIQRNGIRDSELLERILVYIMDNIGQIFSGKKITDYLKSQGRKVSQETVYSHIRALEDAMVIYPVRRYDIKGKKLLQRMEKYFVVDTGLRYAVLGYKENDISQLLENIIYFELLRRGFTVYVGREGDYEVDFVAEKAGEKIYVQVSYMLASPDVVEREYRSLKLIRDNYRKMVLSMDRIPVGAEEGIEHKNIIDFLRE